MAYTSCYCATLLLFVIMVEANILSEIQDWNNGTFYEYGSPTLSEELIFQMEKIYTLTPVFFVIKSSLPQEGNVYVKLEANNIDETIFRFYEGRHPNYPNYKFQVNSTNIEKCQNFDNNNCEELDLCELGESVNEDAANKTSEQIFLSWKVAEKKDTNRNDVTILFQYKNRVVKCRDLRAFKIKKIVIESKAAGQMKSKSMFYKYTTEKKPTTLKNLEINASVALYVRYCWDCKFSFTLSCSNDITKNETNSSSFSFIEFSQNGFDNEGLASRSWQKVILSASAKDKNCSLSITPEELSEGRNNNAKKFWAIGFIDPNEKFTEHSNSTTSNSATSNSTTSNLTTSNSTTSNLTTSNSTTSKCDCCKLDKSDRENISDIKLFALWTVILIIVSLIISIFKYAWKITAKATTCIECSRIMDRSQMTEANREEDSKSQ